MTFEVRRVPISSHLDYCVYIPKNSNEAFSIQLVSSIETQAEVLR